MNTAELTDQLTRLYAAGRKFQFVEQSHKALRLTPHAPDLALLTLRALVELGFGGPARELLQLRGDLNTDDREFAELSATLAATPNGRVPWEKRAGVFSGNMASLLKHRPYLEALADSLPGALTSVHLFQTADGGFQISRRRRAGLLREWLPAMTVEGDESEVDLPPRGQLGVPAILGVRMGSLIQRIHEDTRELFLSYSHPIYLVESDLARFAAWLHCGDHTTLLDDERVYLLLGEDAVDQFRRLFDEQRLPAPGVFVNQSGSTELASCVQRTTEQVVAERDRQLAVMIDELRQRYRERDAAYWADHLKPPGRVLGVTSRFTTMLQYSTRDTLHALEELGYETHILLESKDHHQTPRIAMCRKILELDPVMLVFLDHLRYEFPHIPQNVPFLTWIQDPMANLLCRKAGESIGPLDFVCGYFGERCAREFGYPIDQFVDTDIPVSTRLFHDADLDEPSRAEYACDVSFVSNASMPIDRFCDSALAEYAPALHPLLRAIRERAPGLADEYDHVQPAGAARELVATVAAELGVVLDDTRIDFIATNFAYRIFDWGRRQETLGWVADWARRTGRVFKIYGRGWESHPTLAGFAAGVIEHGEPLRRAYRASKLALQLIPSGFRHQRTHELLASGTLPLTRHCRADFDSPAGTMAIFRGLERIVFASPGQFEALAERFLADEGYRAEVLRDMREATMAGYTYNAVIRKVMERFRDHLARTTAATCVV